MKKLIKYALTALFMLSYGAMYAQINNAKTDTVNPHCSYSSEFC